MSHTARYLTEVAELAAALDAAAVEALAQELRQVRERQCLSLIHI